MAKSEPKVEHYVHLLLDPETGYSSAFSSSEGAAEAALTLGSHLNRKLSVLRIRYYYDKMWDSAAVVQQLKPNL